MYMSPLASLFLLGIPIIFSVNLSLKIEAGATSMLLFVALYALILS